MKGGEHIEGASLRVGLTSSHHLDTGGIEVRLMSGNILLDSREEGRIIKEGVCHKDTGIMSIPSEMGCSLTRVILLQVYIVITSWTSQVLYLCQEVFI